MNRKIYQKKLDNRYNPKYVVQLINNYRSHPDIIGLANHLFYKNELKCLGPKKTLLKPVIFYNCLGHEKKLHDSPR